jgi:antibiotic biosynthesis monooxygenase (ABM) superfamily enzyme
MTRAEKLLPVLYCPCGGEMKVDEDEPLMMITCSHCEASLFYDPRSVKRDELLVRMLTDWLVLTGGPVPGEFVPPLSTAFPNSISVAVPLSPHTRYWDRGTWMYQNGAVSVSPVTWYFITRNPEIINPWLAEEVENDQS